MKLILVFLFVVLTVCSLSIAAASELPICGLWEEYQCQPIPKRGCPDGGQVKKAKEEGVFPECCPQWCPVMCGKKGEKKECNFDQLCKNGEKFFLKGTPGAKWPKCCNRCSNDRNANKP